ncbi:YhfG family protein [Pseudoduganella sp. OTU4001]|uniref:YhfG family protein n=1 Tax=Pseudoduganella sp. OTU4001 TaxID=3043854 RepID=UPI00313EC112
MNQTFAKGIAMLTNEMKLQAFLKIRTRNYRASLRLEGMTPPPAPTSKPAPATPAPKTKHDR